MLTRISILLSVVGVVPLLFASDMVIWHLMPQSLRFTGAYAFYFGAPLSLLAVILAVISLKKHGKNKPGVKACAWSVAEFLAFGLVYLYAILSA
jgi:hypothetical protein